MGFIGRGLAMLSYYSFTVIFFSGHKNWVNIYEWLNGAVG